MRSGFILVVAALLASYQAEPPAELTITDARATATAPAATVGAAYLSIDSPHADTLVSASTAAAERTEMHLSQQQGGAMTMRPLQNVELPAGELVRFEPGGAHFMLIGLREPLRAGTTFALTLRFAKAGERTVDVTVIAPGGAQM